MQLHGTLNALDSLTVDRLERHRAAPTRVSGAAGRCGAGFALFLVLNLILFVRPAEIFPALLNLPIYEVVILACIASSLPVIAEQLSPSALTARPATLFVLALLPAIVLSHLSHGNTYDARIGASEFVKVAMYFLLLTGLITTRRRLFIFVATINLLLCWIAMLAVLQYHHIINLPGLNALEQFEGVDELGDAASVVRLQASGIFQDPNDFSLVLVMALVFQGHLVLERASGGMRRLAGLLPIPLLGYAFALTQSRGGFLALLAGCGAYLWSRWGWRRAAVVGVALLPVLWLALAGRQTSIDLNDSDDTAQGRILLWREALALFKSAPLFGIGKGAMIDEVGYVAHNSFLHCFAELGAVGGTLFVGAMYVPLAMLRRAQPEPKARSRSAGDRLDAWRPCFLAMLCAYIVGICTLSRAYALPTYLALGLAGAYCLLRARSSGVCPPRLSIKLMSPIAVLSAVIIIGFNIFVRVFAQ